MSPKSLYLWTKQKAEEALEPFKDRVLVLRLGLCLNADLKHPGSGFARLRRRAEQGHPLSHSGRCLTCLPELLPRMIVLIRERRCVVVFPPSPSSPSCSIDPNSPLFLFSPSHRVGSLNLTNPGLLSENRLFSLYKQYVLPDLKWKAPESQGEHPPQKSISAACLAAHLTFLSFRSRRDPLRGRP